MRIFEKSENIYAMNKKYVGFVLYRALIANALEISLEKTLSRLWMSAIRISLAVPIPRFEPRVDRPALLILTALWTIDCVWTKAKYRNWEVKNSRNNDLATKKKNGDDASKEHSADGSTFDRRETNAKGKIRIQKQPSDWIMMRGGRSTPTTTTTTFGLRASPWSSLTRLRLSESTLADKR